jgi:hypothetical protein
MHFTSKIFLKLLISFCFIIIFYNHLSIKKIYAKTCDFNTFCPDGYKTVNGCIAGKIGQVTDN